MMGTIATLQNEANSLTLLAAQRQLYSDAKILFLWKLVLTVVATFVVSVYSYMTSPTSEWHTAIVAGKLLICLIPLISFDFLINKKKETAAKIQTLFDTSVFGIAWTDAQYGLKGDLGHSIVKASSRHERRHRDWRVTLENWYTRPESDADHLMNIHNCQKENIEWESDLRGSFSRFCLIILLLVIGGTTVVALIYDQKMSWSLEYVFLPVVPIVVFLSQVVLENSRTSCRANVVRIQSSVVEKVLQAHSYDTSSAMREIEALELQIFRYRNSAFLIPDFYYRVHARLEKHLFSRGS